MEAEIEVVLSQAKEGLEQPEAVRGKKGSSCRDRGGNMALETLLFWTSGPRTMGE